jgi:predicted metalloenzyme YecM
MVSQSLLQQQQLLPQQMMEQLPTFIRNIEVLASKLKLDLKGLQADHIAMRINDKDVAKQAHKLWLDKGRQISNARINGRPIIVIEFDQPLSTSYGSIECLELPYPAKGKLYPTQGWEHVEFVVPSEAQSAEEFFDELTHKSPDFAKQCDQLDALGISIKLSSPKGEGERLANPTVAFKHKGVCIKLHPHSLKSIVHSEQSE